MKQLSLLGARFSSRRLLWIAVLFAVCDQAAHAAVPPATPPSSAPPSAGQGQAAKLTVVENKDLSGKVYKKLGLPERKYCWDACLQEERCSGVRWGVIEREQAGLCLLMTGPLTLKDPVAPRTEDGKRIRVTVARKQVSGSSGT